MLGGRCHGSHVGVKVQQYGGYDVNCIRSMPLRDTGSFTYFSKIQLESNGYDRIPILVQHATRKPSRFRKCSEFIQNMEGVVFPWLKF